MPKISWSDMRVRAAAAVLAAVGVVIAVSLTSAGQPDGSGAGLDAWNVADEREAAHVNDVIITEGSVTQAIRDFREVTVLVDDDAWHGWLESNHSTPEAFRDDRLDVLVHEELIRQAAELQDVEVSDQEITNEVEQRRAEFLEDGLEEDGAWENALALNGYTEKTYWQSVRTSLLEKALARKVGWGETYGTWIQQFEAGCDIERTPAPEDLPYL